MFVSEQLFLVNYTNPTNYLIIFVIILSFYILLKFYFFYFFSENEDHIDLTDPCRYPVAVGLEKEYIPDSSMWASSVASRGRGPEYARLNGWGGSY